MQSCRCISPQIRPLPCLRLQWLDSAGPAAENEASFCHCVTPMPSPQICIVSQALVNEGKARLDDLQRHGFKTRLAQGDTADLIFTHAGVSVAFCFVDSAGQHDLKSRCGTGSWKQYETCACLVPLPGGLHRNDPLLPTLLSSVAHASVR